MGHWFGLGSVGCFLSSGLTWVYSYFNYHWAIHQGLDNAPWPHSCDWKLVLALHWASLSPSGASLPTRLPSPHSSSKIPRKQDWRLQPWNSHSWKLLQISLLPHSTEASKSHDQPLFKMVGKRLPQLMGGKAESNCWGNRTGAWEKAGTIDFSLHTWGHILMSTSPPRT